MVGPSFGRLDTARLDLDQATAAREAAAKVLRWMSRTSLDGTFLWRLAEITAHLLEFQDFVIYLEEGDSLTQAAATGVKNDGGRISDPLQLAVGAAIVGRCFQEGITIYTPDTSKSADYVADQVPAMSELTVPVFSENTAIAVFDTEHSEIDGFSPWQVCALEMIADAAGSAINQWRGLSSVEFPADDRSRRTEAISSFAGNMAHDLNNLLAIAEMNSELLRHEGTSTADVAEALEQMVHRARHLTARLAALTAHGPSAIEVLDVREIITQVVGAAEQTPGINIELKMDDSLPLVHGDKMQIRQALFGLVSNAVEALDGHGQIAVVASATDDGPNPRLSILVADDGPGMTADIAARVFDPYFSTKAQGVGLGLAASFLIAVGHGGDLTLVTSPGEGATFTLTIPGLPGRLAESPSTAATIPPLDMMVLEDDPLVGEVLGDLLKLLGHNSHIYQTGEQLLAAFEVSVARDERPDILLLDIRNDLGLGGISTLRTLSRRYEGIRAIAMSGYSDATLEDTRLLGFAGSLSKPFGIDELAVALLVAYAKPAV